jgi:5-(carboxyamino)imidazole ribonucleotide mutase
MPKGVPVATVALNGAANAGILAAQIVGAFDTALSMRLREYKEKTLKDKVTQAVKTTKAKHPNYFDK